MKRLLFILLLFISFQSFGQNRFPTIDSLQNYTLRYFRNSTVETFTNLRGQNIVYGLSEFIDSLAGNGAVDSIWFSSDTLKYSKQGVNYVVGIVSGGGGSGKLNISDTAAMLLPYVRKTTTININGVEQDLSANRQWRTALTNTGVLTYSGMTIASSTTVNIGAVKGIITDNETDPEHPDYVLVDYAGASGVTVPTITTGLATFVLLDRGVVISGVGAGSLVFQNTPPTSAQRKQMILLSKVSHADSATLGVVVNAPDFVTSPLQQFRDLFNGIEFLNKGVKASGNSALTIKTSAGTIIGEGVNFVNDRTKPNDEEVAAQDTTSFLLVNRSGPTPSFQTAIDPTTYDLNGVTTAIGGGTNNSTIQYLRYIPDVGYIIQRGQTVYNSLSDAVSAVGKEDYIVRPTLTNGNILIAAICMRRSATNMNDPNYVRILSADKFGQLGSAASGVTTATLQTAYINSVIPQILTNSTNGAVTLQRGSAADTDTVLAVRNGAGANTFAVTGNGVVRQQVTSSMLKGDATGNIVAAVAGVDYSVSGIDSLRSVMNLNQTPETGFITNLDTITFFGDSYTFGSGATTTPQRWTSKLASYFNAIEDNRGVAGVTLMKQPPVNYMASPNMSDNKTTIPVWNKKRKLLVFAFGLNDLGQTAAAYNVTNFKNTYDSIIDYAVNIKGWPLKNILIIPPFYIGQEGYDRYATITGNAAPDRQRHLDFVEASRASAFKNGTLYFNIFDNQIRNDTTLLVTAGGDYIHANDSGHLYIARNASNYFLYPTNSVLIVEASGINRGFKVSNSGQVSNYAVATFSPIHNTAGDIGTVISAQPNGSGYIGTIRSGLQLFNTNFRADATNYELLFMQANPSYYSISSQKGGTGTIRPIYIDASGSNSAASSNIIFNTNGSTGIHTADNTSGAGANTLFVGDAAAIISTTSGNFSYIGNNYAFNGSVFVRRNAGYASFFKFDGDNGDLSLQMAGTSTEGSTLTTNRTFTFSQANGSITAEQFRISDLNTAPASASDTGTKGEIRITANYIYICTATNTWVRAALATW